MKDFTCVLLQQQGIQSNSKNHGIVYELRDVEFDETSGSEIEDKNLEGVRGAKIDKTMKYKATGYIRPREVQEVDDDSIGVVPPTSV